MAESKSPHYSDAIRHASWNFMPVPLTPGLRTEALIKYLPADYEILREGDFVRCAATGQAMALDDLLYWDVTQQIAFASAGAAFGLHPRNRSG